MRHRDSKPDGQADADIYTWREILDIFIAGNAKPAGSKRAFAHAKTGRIIVADDCKTTKQWQNLIRYHVQWNFTDPPLTVPIRLNVAFIRRRPRSHYGTGRNADKVKRSAPAFPITRPDRGKLLRAVEDALTGIVYRDDAQVVDGYVVKTWADREDYPHPGAHIHAFAYLPM